MPRLPLAVCQAFTDGRCLDSYVVRVWASDDPGFPYRTLQDPRERSVVGRRCRLRTRGSDGNVAQRLERAIAPSPPLVQDLAGYGIRDEQRHVEWRRNARRARVDDVEDVERAWHCAANATASSVACCAVNEPSVARSIGQPDSLCEGFDNAGFESFLLPSSFGLSVGGGDVGELMTLLCKGGSRSRLMVALPRTVRRQANTDGVLVFPTA